MKVGKILEKKTIVEQITDNDSLDSKRGYVLNIQVS